MEKNDVIEEGAKVEEFKPLPFWRELFLKKEELQEYYIKKREYQYNNNQHLKGQKIRDFLHPILLALMSFDRKYLKGQTLTVLKDEREETDKPVIYAITHVGMYDIQLVSEAIKDHQYTFLGDPETMYRTGDGAIMSLNGVVYCDTDSKTDRAIAKKTAIDVLNRGNNLMIYPEGVWNLSANLVSLPLFPGIIDIALDTDCDIVPVAIEQYGKDFFVNIGKNMQVNPDKKEFATEEERKKFVELKKQDLRDTMSTLKWEIFESRPVEQRAMYGDFDEEYKKYKDTRYNEWVDSKTKTPFYNDEIVSRRTFRIKGINFASDVFSHLRDLTIKKENAFLFRKRSGTLPEIEEDISRKLK
ncbi:MAG: 1-acyl-sn-glycerol-3-phosphate acyltransferase [Bacilli bacterium]|nr:1-acyl-sn-glycerol-3-phosphate acyltransferase [Bacilli bacterium]